MRNWSRGRETPGIAHGWQGSAWLWCHQVLAGLRDFENRTAEAIGRRISRTMATDDRCVSALWGSAANVVVAALLAAIDRDWQDFSDTVSDQWASEIARVEPRRDVMRGAAGAVLALAEAYQYTTSRRLDRALERMHAVCVETLGDLLTGSGDCKLGMAHGVAGYVLALETTKRLQVGPYPRTLADSALALFDRTKIPLRVAGRPVFWPERASDTVLNAHGWCHGGPGIALALLGSFELSGDQRYWRLARRAIGAISAPLNRDPSICCGSLGRINILIEVHRARGGARWLNEAWSIWQSVPKRFQRPRWLRRGLWKGTLGWYYTRERLRHPQFLPFPQLGLLSAVRHTHARCSGAHRYASGVSAPISA